MSAASYLAWRFHNVYESLAPEFGYETRPDTRVEFSRLPDANRNLMIAVCQQLIDDKTVQVLDQEYDDQPPSTGDAA